MMAAIIGVLVIVRVVVFVIIVVLSEAGRMGVAVAMVVSRRPRLEDERRENKGRARRRQDALIGRVRERDGRGGRLKRAGSRRQLGREMACGRRYLDMKTHHAAPGQRLVWLFDRWRRPSPDRRMRRLGPERPLQRPRVAFDLPHDGPGPVDLVPQPLALDLVVVGLEEGKVAPVALILQPDGHRQADKEDDDNERDESKDLAEGDAEREEHWVNG
jgi:hypothetical protein